MSRLALGLWWQPPRPASPGGPWGPLQLAVEGVALGVPCVLSVAVDVVLHGVLEGQDAPPALGPLPHRSYPSTPRPP